MLSEYLDKVHLDDCITFMGKLPDKSVDLVLTDPPYELDWRQSLHFKNRKTMFHHREETVKWDKGVKELYGQIFPEFNRVVKDNGSVIMFTRSEYITYAVDAAKSNEFDNKATICWYKTNPMPQVRKRNYLSSIELILWVARYHESKCLYTLNFTSQRDMHNLIRLPICSGAERLDHPTQKPLVLMEKFVMKHSNIDDVILDPFAGSGTTGVASIKLGRKFLGCDADEKYVDMANGRLSSELEKQRLF